VLDGSYVEGDTIRADRGKDGDLSFTKIETKGRPQ
jgi:hypothetical protein